MTEVASVATRRTLLREIRRLPPRQVEEVLLFVRSLREGTEEQILRSERMAQAVRVVLGWAARADTATADRDVLEEPVAEAEINEAPEAPFTLPRLSRVVGAT